MRTTGSITIGAFALAALLMPDVGFGSSDQQQHQAGRPSVDHGVQGSLDAGAGKMPLVAPEFVAHAAQAGLGEVALGELAAIRASNEDVKQLARRVAEDHSKANEELASLASSKNIPVPTEPDADHKMLLEQLRGMSGPEFDRAFMQAMISDHDRAAAKFMAFAERGDDPELKKWAAKTLPTIQAHERMAKETAAKVSDAGGQSSRDKAIAY